MGRGDIEHNGRQLFEEHYKEMDGFVFMLVVWLLVEFGDGILIGKKLYTVLR